MTIQRLLTVLLICMNTYSVHAKESILVIESYHAEYEWDKDFNRGISEVIGDQYQIENFYMDTKRLAKTEYQNRADAAWEKYKQVKPSLVILADDNALKLLGKRFEKEPTLVVYLGINGNPRNYVSLDSKNITGVIERPLLKRSLVILSKILTPNPKKILVLLDNGTTSNVTIESMGGKKQFRLSGIDISVKAIGSWQEWQNSVLKAKENGYDALIVGLYHTIKDHGKAVAAEKVITWTSEHTPIPPFGFWSFSIGADKAIGGLVLDGYYQGELAAKIALKGLKDGKFFHTFPKTAEEGELLFSQTQMNKWNITLPTEIEKKAILIK